MTLSMEEKQNKNKNLSFKITIFFNERMREERRRGDFFRAVKNY